MRWLVHSISHGAICEWNGQAYNWETIYYVWIGALSHLSLKKYPFRKNYYIGPTRELKRNYEMKTLTTLKTNEIKTNLTYKESEKYHLQ